MFGYASNETPEFMPATISYSHAVLRRLSELRKKKAVDFLRPDAKSQVTAEYRNGKLSRIDAVVVSTQHAEHVSHKDLSDYVINKCIKEVIPGNLLDRDTKYFSIQLAALLLVDLKVDCGLQVARSSLIPTVDMVRTAGVLSLVRIHRRSIARLHTWAAILRRTLLQQDLPISA